MALSIDEKRKIAIEKHRAAQVRARNKQLAKLNDPIEKAKRRTKQLEAQERSREKQRIKLADPNYQKQQREKQIAKQQSKASKPTIKRAKPSRGLKGRTPTALERGIMDTIGKQCCIACLLHGRESPIVSLHHIWGRVIDNAHAFVLPLCCFHHDTLLEAGERAKYPDMLPLHAKGKYGGKAQWQAHNGTELELLYKVYEIAGLDASIIPNTH